jgi:hypothetical protein
MYCVLTCVEITYMLRVMIFFILQKKHGSHLTLVLLTFTYVCVCMYMHVHAKHYVLAHNTRLLLSVHGQS